MAAERRTDLATALDGLGGAPARPGVVHLVGAGRRDTGDGPADPATLTVRAAVLVSTADHVLLAPDAAGELARLAPEHATVADWEPEAGVASLPSGAVVLVLPGDPAEHPATAELLRALRADGRELELVAGVSTARAALAAAGISTPPTGRAGETAVLAFDHAPPDPGRLAAELTAAGWAPESRVHLVEAPAGPRQRVRETTLDRLATETVRSHGVVVVLGPASRVPWREELPLAGVSVLVPRASAQASRLSMQVRSLGGEPVEAPTITIEPGDDAALRAALRDLADGAFAGLCLTSPNGVDAVADALDATGLDARAFAEVSTVACVGPGTAARLRQRLHVRADLLPPVSTTAALAEAYPAGSGRVLLPRADIATNLLHDGLRAKGWEPVEVPAYVTGVPDGLPGPVLERLAAGRIDLLAFASSSTARNFAALVGDRPWQGAVVSIGPVTSATCAELGLPVALEADPHDLDGLVAALCKAAGER